MDHASSNISRERVLLAKDELRVLVDGVATLSDTLVSVLCAFGLLPMTLL